MPLGSSLAMLLEPSTRLNSKVGCFVKFHEVWWVWHCYMNMMFAHLNYLKKNFHRIHCSDFKVPQRNSRQALASIVFNLFWPPEQKPSVLVVSVKLDDFLLKPIFSVLWEKLFFVFFIFQRAEFLKGGDCLDVQLVVLHPVSFCSIHFASFFLEPHTKVSVTYAIMWQAHDVWFPTP